MPSHTLYLSLTDAAGVQEKARIASAMHRMPYATAEDARAMADAATRWASTPDTVRETCTACGRAHDAVYTIRRVLADTLGVWPVYRINGGMRVLGDGIPYTVSRLPRDASRLAPEDAARYWHREDNATADALRSAIAAHNAAAAR